MKRERKERNRSIKPKCQNILLNRSFKWMIKNKWKAICFDIKIVLKISKSIWVFFMFFNPFLNWSLDTSFKTFPSSKWLEWVWSSSMFFYHFTSGGITHDQAFQKWLWLSVLQFLSDNFKTSCRILTFQKMYNAHVLRIQFVSVVTVENLTWKYENFDQNINNSYLEEFHWCYFSVYLKCPKIVHTFCLQAM